MPRRERSLTVEARLDRVADDIAIAFARACEALEPLRSDSKLLLGCSAGGDSMALLQLMAGESQRRGWTLAVAHLDHAQRPEGKAEAKFVALQCKKLGVRFISKRLRVSRSSKGTMSEEALRNARHDFFRGAMKRCGASALILAHQADDRAETFFIRLLAGSGPTGLSSIRAVEKIEGMAVVRPLLSIRREALRNYLRDRKIPWRDDPTNDDLQKKRAWVRHKLLPLLNRRIETDVVPRITRAADLIEEESSALDQACAVFLEQIVGSTSFPSLGRFSLRDPIWRRAGKPLRRRLLRQWLWNLREAPHPPGFQAVEEALKFAERGKEGTALRTIERIHLLKRKGSLVAYPNEIMKR